MLYVFIHTQKQIKVNTIYYSSLILCLCETKTNLQINVKQKQVYSCQGLFFQHNLLGTFPHTLTQTENHNSNVVCTLIAQMPETWQSMYEFWTQCQLRPSHKAKHQRKSKCKHSMMNGLALDCKLKPTAQRQTQKHIIIQ